MALTFSNQSLHTNTHSLGFLYCIRYIVEKSTLQVQRTYDYKGKFPKFIHGRGGTDFDPVFEYINRDRSVKYDGCIYLTDGYANTPTKKPRCKVFWIITPDGELGPHLKYGKAVKLNN